MPTVLMSSNETSFVNKMLASVFIQSIIRMVSQVLGS